MATNVANEFATIRLPKTLVDQARKEADTFKRSIGGQVEYWATLGQAIEAAPGFTLDRVKAALAGTFDADQLSVDERAYFDEGLGDALSHPTAAELAFFETQSTEGGNVGYDDEGNLVRGLPGGGTVIIEAKKG